MIHGFEFLDKGCFYALSQSAETDGAVVQQPVGNLAVDDGVYQFGNVFFGILFQTARGGFDSIGHHENSLFFGERVGTGVGKQFFIDLLVGVFVHIGVVEIFGFATSVMSLDKIDYVWGRLSFSAILTPSFTWLMTICALSS